MTCILNESGILRIISSYSTVSNEKPWTQNHTQVGNRTGLNIREKYNSCSAMHHKLLPNIESNKEIDASCITAELQLTPVSFTGRYKARGPSCGCLKEGEGSPARSVLPAAILPPSLPARPEPPPWGNGRVRGGGRTREPPCARAARGRRGGGRSGRLPRACARRLPLAAPPSPGGQQGPWRSWGEPPVTPLPSQISDLLQLY